MTIKVLGPGCMNCRTLEKRTQDAVASLGVDAMVEKVVDVMQIATYGILRTPGEGVAVRSSGHSGGGRHSWLCPRGLHGGSNGKVRVVGRPRVGDMP